MRSLHPVFLALAVSACSSSSSVDDPAVARVGQVTITASELRARVPGLAQLFRAELARALLQRAGPDIDYAVLAKVPLPKF
jgi:hypothetical protein